MDVKVSNVSCNADSDVLPAAIIVQSLKRLKRPVPKVAYSGEERDWPAHNTRIMVCAENENVVYTLNRDIVKILPTNSKVLRKPIQIMRQCSRTLKIAHKCLYHGD